MKRAVFALWLTTLALTAAAQDLPVPAPMPPPMRVPMPSLATESVSATAPMTLTTSAPVTTPMPSSVSTSPSPAPGDIDPESRVLPAPPPPGLPVVVMTQAIPCNVDMAYRKKNVDCALSVLKGVLTIIDLGSVPEVSLEEAALRAGPTGGGQIFSSADRDLIDGVTLMQSGNWSEAHSKLWAAYREIEHLSQISEYGKNSVRSLLEFSEAAENLSVYDNAGAMAGFIQSYQDAQDPNTEAAALFAAAQSEISALHQERASELLKQAYGQAGPNLKPSILLAKVGVQASLKGYDSPAIDGAARQAIENAQSGQQKAYATLLYAALVHNVDQARARQILDDAEALCNSDADWARNQRQTIEQYRQTWGG